MLNVNDVQNAPIIRITQAGQVATLSGIIKVQRGTNTVYELHLGRKVVFNGPACPYAFSQKWVPLFKDAEDARYFAVSGYHSYKVQLSCSMAGPIIESMELRK